MTIEDFRSPWLDIPASDYEGHMGPGGADQLSPLSEIFGEVYVRLRPRRVAVLGCATGNGLEHVNAEWTDELVAVDINRAYLDVLRSRHKELAAILETVCAPAESCPFAEGTFDLISAALIFEYLDPRMLLERAFSWLAQDGAMSVVLQIEHPRHGAVTKTRFDSLRSLESVMRLVPPESFEKAAGAAGFGAIESEERVLRNDKRLYVGLLRKR